MEKTERPTQSRIDDLRDQGIVAKSVFAMRATGTAALLLSLFLQRDAFTRILWQLPEIGSRLSVSAQVWSELLGLLLVPTLSYVVGVCIAGFIQTKFLFRPELVALRGARLSFRGGMKPALQAMATSLLAFLPAILLLWFLLPDLLQMFNNEDAYMQRFFAEALARGVFPLCFGLLIVAFLGWLISRELFLRAHRMTRGEVRSQSREV